MSWQCIFNSLITFVLIYLDSIDMCYLITNMHRIMYGFHLAMQITYTKNIVYESQALCLESERVIYILLCTNQCFMHGWSFLSIN